MKILYLECKMGIAGDMLASALLGTFEDKEKIIGELNSMGIPKVAYKNTKTEKCAVVGEHISVLIDGEEEESADVSDHHHDHEHSHNHDHEHEHHQDHHHDHDHHEHSHSSLYEIEEIIEGLSIPKEIRSDIREVYQLLAEAESEVHGVNVSDIHFHEVGKLDAIADIAAVCYMMHEIDPDKVIVSPINVGNGQVRTSHGILPVPAPATANLLRGIPSYSSDRISGELCTPTGAALVKYFAFDFGAQPVMAVDRIGYGMGKKDFPQANCVRAIVGEANDEADVVVELSCNVDDMTPEEIGFATEMLFEAGALEVYTISIAMKKNRPGFLLTCMCREDKKETVVKTIFKHTTTIGIRENVSNRYVLTRQIEKIQTPYGEVRIKNSSGYDVQRRKFEYDDLAGISRRTGKSVIELKKELIDFLPEE